MDSKVTLSDYWRLVRTNRNFRLLWSAQIVSELGDWFYSIAVYSLLLEFTGSATAVATAVVLQVLPQFLIGPTAGVVNDRMSRRKVMIIADLARAALVLGMLLVRGPGMAWLVYTLLFFETTMWAFFEPGRTAVIPSVVGGQDIVVANTLSSTTWSVNLAIGATLGGVVAVFFGRNTVFLLNAVSFLVSAYFLRKMRLEEAHMLGRRGLRARDLVDFSPILEGIRYVRRDRRLLATLLTKAGLGVMGANLVILPILGERVFPISFGHMDPQRAGMLGMSVLLGSRGVGALVGPLIGGYWAGGDRVRLRKGILFGFLASALGYIALGPAPSIWAACAAVIFAHAGGSIIWVFSTTLLHFQTDDRFRGRVFSADFMCLMLTMSLVSYATGILMDAGISARSMAVYMGAFGLLPTLFWAGALRLWRDQDPSLVPDDGNP